VSGISLTLEAHNYNTLCDGQQGTIIVSLCGAYAQINMADLSKQLGDFLH